jgi:IrrE N-terminal-like domain
MRFYRGQDGSQQFFIKDAALDDLAESELARARLLPTAAAPAVDIEAFIERYLGALLDEGAELESTVLGLTELQVGRPPRVLINRDLSDAAFEEDPGSGTLGRWRATLAHEATHVMIHRVLFELNADQGTLFGDDGAATMFRCLKREVAFAARPRDPRETQANKGMAGLLMPRTLFGQFARDGRRDSRNEPELIEDLARTFQVSRQAARIRLQSLGFLEPDGTYVKGLMS